MKAAFSLLELLLVIVLLGVVAGLAMPNFGRSYERFQLKNTAEQMADLMRYAQSQAISKQIPYQFQFDPEFAQYWLAKRDSSSPSIGPQQFSQRIKNQWGRTFRVPDSITIEAEHLFLTFYPNGRMDKERISLCRDEDCFTVSTQEQLGEIKVFDASTPPLVADGGTQHQP